jgi:hypothetical protein
MMTEENATDTEAAQTPQAPAKRKTDAQRKKEFDANRKAMDELCEQSVVRLLHVHSYIVLYVIVCVSTVSCELMSRDGDGCEWLRMRHKYKL